MAALYLSSLLKPSSSVDDPASFFAEQTETTRRELYQMPSTTSTHHWHLLPHMWLPSLFTARVAHASARPHLLFVYWTPSHPVLPIHRLASTILSPSTLVFALRWIVLIHQQQKHKNACIATLKYKCLCSTPHISFCASCLCTPLQQNSWKVFFFL